MIKNDNPDVFPAEIENAILWANKATTGKAFYLESSSVNLAYSQVEAIDCASLDIGIAVH